MRSCPDTDIDPTNVCKRSIISAGNCMDLGAVYGLQISLKIAY